MSIKYKKYPDIDVRHHLFKIYKGVCQYCHQRKDFNKMITEHIVSRYADSLTLYNYYNAIGELCYPDDWTLYPVGDFWVVVYPVINLKPPRDYWYNYTLACRSCNAVKGKIGDNLHPDELLYMLKNAYNNILCRQGELT